jgi:hypothetical protein
VKVNEGIYEQRLLELARENGVELAFEDDSYRVARDILARVDDGRLLLMIFLEVNGDVVYGLLGRDKWDDLKHDYFARGLVIYRLSPLYKGAGIRLEADISEMSSDAVCAVITQLRASGFRLEKAYDLAKKAFNRAL